VIYAGGMALVQVWQKFWVCTLNRHIFIDVKSYTKWHIMEFL